MNEIVKYETSAGMVELSPDTVRRYLVSGAGVVSDQEIMMYLQLCKYRKLNPFLGEVYLIKYGREPASMVVGKDALLRRAVAHPRYRGHEAGVVCLAEGATKPVRTLGIVPEKTTLLGGWARLHMEGLTVPVEIEVSLQEYIGRKRDGSITQMWRTKAATMIRKVALVQVIREAIPEETGGMYDAAEMPVDGSLPEDAIEPAPNPIEPLPRNVTPAPGLNPQPEQPSPAPAPEHAQPPEKATKQEPPPRRRRANKWDVDPAIFGGSELITCGSTPDQLLAIRRFCSQNKALKERVLAELERITGYHEMSYLRQDEADEIMTLCLARQPAAATTPPPDLPDDLVDCPDSEGDRRSISKYCTAGKCTTRNEAGWCPAVDDDPAGAPPEGVAPGPDDQEPDPWEEYRQALLAHDWRYQFSDDPSVYRRGGESWSRVSAMHEQLKKVDQPRADDMMAKHGRD